MEPAPPPQQPAPPSTASVAVFMVVLFALVALGVAIPLVVARLSRPPLDATKPPTGEEL